MKLMIKAVLFASTFLLTATQVSAERNPDNAARDQYRHPIETLDFFTVSENMTVVEISPGGGWYTEVLADRINGTIYAAHANPETKSEYYLRSLSNYKKMLAASPELYGNVEMSIFDANAQLLSTPDEIADAVLTFRNVHNWMKSKNDAAAFGLFFKTLKPGGVLGVVEHRAKPGTDRDSMIKSGYVTQDYVTEIAERAGFVLEASSEVNANPADTANHPKGVWTLLPNLAMGDEDRDSYKAIGESDRMTLRFRKPAQ
ncbi:MAG: methyltransferase domain-containing protein [Porticoccaceae bacterium]|nr:methyltransferase domain-containing protein [Porticoccaceae bacterium]